MPSLTIRNLDDALTSRLLARAAHHGRSIEAEGLEILRDTLPEETQPREELAPILAERIRRRIEPLGGVDLEIPPR